MARKVNANHYEDNYLNYECQSCKRKFIVGETLSKGVKLTCPYCQSPNLELISCLNEEDTEELDLGCFGIYFDCYRDGSLMLYTEREFGEALENAIKHGASGNMLQIIESHCAMRDGHLNK